LKLLFLCDLFELVRPLRLPLNPFWVFCGSPLRGLLLGDSLLFDIPLPGLPLSSNRPRLEPLGDLKSVSIPTLSILGSSFLSIFRDLFRVIVLKLS